MMELNLEGWLNRIKANVDLSNLTEGLKNTICNTAAGTTSTATNERPAVVVKNYRNGKNWYRIWSDGWIEQGGEVACTNGNATVNLLVAHNNANYNSELTLICESPTTFYSGVIFGKNTSGFTVYQNVGYSYSIKGQWRTEGY